MQCMLIYRHSFEAKRIFSMSTRSLICIFYQGDFPLAQYAEFDGYPEGQGLKILSFLRDDANIVHLKDGIVKVYTPNDVESQQIDKEIRELQEVAPEMSCNTGHFQDLFSYGNNPLTKFYPSLSPEAGARILTIIAQPTLDSNEKVEVPIVKNLRFANDAVHCEWAYVIDLDEEVFEVFNGSQTKAGSVCKRFDNVGTENDTVPKLIKSFHFDSLPETERQFYEAIEPDY